MRISIASPIPVLGSLPGPSRPGWGPIGSYDFQFEVIGAVTIEAFPNTDGESFTIKWQDGTTTQTSGSSTINSPAGAGIISINNEDDNTYADEFKIVSGQLNVTKVISWGQNPWSNVFEAFKDCENLTDIGTTSFIASGQGPNNNQGCYMTKMFDGCTSLLEVDIRSWNLEAGVSWKTGSPFIGLVNLEKIDATGLKIKFQDNSSYARNWFSNVGSATTNGCEFKLSGLDYSSTTNTGMIIDGIFGSVKFKDGSNLSNWKFPSHANSRYIYWFSSARISGTLDMSGWTTFNGSSLESMFYRFNQHLTAADGSKINMSNLGLTYATSFYRMFWECEISEIIGLNTWGATSGSLVNLRDMFKAATLMRINPSDNFSSAFTSSLNVDNVRDMCNSLSSGLDNADVGVAPSFAGADFSNMTGSFYGMFTTAKIINSPDFSTCTFSASNPINFGNIFRTTTITDTNNHFILNNQNLAILSLSQSFWQTSIRRVTIGDNVDLSNLVSINYMSYQAGFDTHGLTLPSDADYSSLATIGDYAFSWGSLSTCQVDTFIRQNWATNLNTGLVCDLENNKITAAPSIARSNAASLTSVRSWNITVGSPDTPLPFAYASYAVDPTGITTISPTTTPPAGSVFTATNGLSINASGVITIGSFRGGSTIRCTYPDGCYNEVQMVIMVPFVMRTTIPASGSTSAYVLKPQMSDGECFVNWGDTTETLTGDTTHNYPASGSDTTYDIEIFDSPGGSKFEGFNAAWDTTTITSYENSIMQWGEIQWKNNSWFLTGLPNSALPKLRLSAPNGASHKPDLSQVTSLYRLFYNWQKSRNLIWEDVNNNLADWDTSTITNMAQAFFLSGSPSSRPSDGQPNTMQLSNWDVSNVTNMQSIFFGWANSSNGYFNSNIGVDITNWNTQNVQDFSNAFRCKGALTGIENLRTESCTNMSYMFDSRAFPGNVNTKYVNGALRWDVSKVSNFKSFNYKGSSSEGFFPDKWKLSGDGQDVDMANAFWTFRFQATDSQDLCATKTVNETWYGGTSYTAWDMSNTTDISNMFRGARPSSYNPNISTWQISDKLTTMQYFARADGSQISGLLGLDQDLGHWDVTNISSPNGLKQITGFRNANERPNFSTSNYDSILSIVDGWGSQAANVNSGVDMDFGTSKYSPGNALAVSRGNVSNPAGIPSGQMFVYDANVVIKDLTSVGDIVQLMNGGSTYGEFAKITGYLATDDRVAFVDVLGGDNFPINWPGVTWQYQIYDSDAAKGRYALLEAGWTITDGGVDIAFESAEIEIEIAPGQETFTIGTWGYMSTKIDWGDGNGFINNPATNQPYTSYINSFTYPTTGQTEIYRVKIRENDTETFNGWRFGQYGNGDRVRKIISWGSQLYTTYYQAFQGANLNKAGFTNTLPVDSNGKVTKPQWISSITNFSRAFAQCNMPANADWSNWSTGVAATNLNYMFGGNANFTGTGLSNWDVSKVTNISSFIAGTAFNSDISGWDLQSCTNAAGLFSGTPFNHPSISNLNLHNITSIHSMFEGCTAFNQDINTKVVGTGADAYLAWDTDPVTTMYGCFKGCSNFNYSIDKWNIGQLDAFSALASFFYSVGSNLTNGYTHNLLTKDVTVGAGTPAAKTYVAWDVSQVNGFGGTSQNYTTTQGMFQNSKFNGDISNWDMSGLGAQGGHAYSAAGQWGRVFFNNPIFNQDISTKTITNVSGKGTYTAWDMSNWTGGRYPLSNTTAFNQNIGNWILSTTDVSNGDMLQFFGYSGMSSANYTDSFTGWANTAKTNNGFPKNKAFGRQYNRTFDTTRTNGITAFTVNTAGRARSYLTLDVTVSNGASSINGVYFYDFANDKWVKETDSSATIEWNTEESTWDVSYEGVVQHNGSGGTQAAGPDSSTSWSGGISVVDSSLGWSISSDTITN